MWPEYTRVTSFQGSRLEGAQKELINQLLLHKNDYMLDLPCHIGMTMLAVYK